MSTLNGIKLCGTRRHGAALIYIIVLLSVMMGFCSLAVDFGRVQVAKTQLRRACDAAARVAIYQVMQGASNTTAKNTAISMASNDTVDSTALTLTSSQVSIGNWNTGTKTFTSGGTPTNAVRITVAKSIPLLWGSVLGKGNCSVNVTAIAACQTTSQTITISAKSNLWLSGAASGTQGSVPDGGWSTAHNSSNHQWKYDVAGTYLGNVSGQDAYGDPTSEPYASPAPVTITLIPGAALQVTSVSGAMNNDAGSGATPIYDATGSASGTIAAYSNEAATNSNAPGYSGASNTGTTTINGTSYSSITGSEHGIANISTPIDSLNGVFLTSNDPSTEGTAPAGYDFSTQTARDYANLQPQTRQPFYVGDGQTSGNSQQTIIVPTNAARLFLGTMDGHEWSNNLGSFTATITQTYITMVQ